MPKTTVVITGASQGIGFETAKNFAKLENFEIYALSRNKSKLGKLLTVCAGLSKTSKIIPIAFDLETLVTQSSDLLQKFPDNFSHIDILINNAGFLVNKPFKEVSIDEIQRIIRINFMAPALLIKELLPYMGNKGLTHVINIGSMGGFQGSLKFPGLSFYSASKAALANITECLSAEYENSGIIFNCLALGAVQTEMLEKAFPGYKAPITCKEMGKFIAEFAIKGHIYFKGKIIPVSTTNP
jgi:short-subunit dehydrogenase